jgi:hypothetical protein
MNEVMGCAGVFVSVGCHCCEPLRDKAEPVKARPVLGGWLAEVKKEYRPPCHHLAAVVRAGWSG